MKVEHNWRLNITSTGFLEFVFEEFDERMYNLASLNKTPVCMLDLIYLDFILNVDFLLQMKDETFIINLK